MLMALVVATQRAGGSLTFTPEEYEQARDALGGGRAKFRWVRETPEALTIRFVRE